MQSGPLRLTVHRHQFRLRNPYVLSFATLEHIDTFYVTAEQNGAVGHGEVTPLPGYSDESAGSVIAALEFIGKNEPTEITEITESLSTRAPILTSGITCAIETLDDQGAWNGLEKPIPLAGLCAGTAPEAAAAEARELCSQGYKALKMKIGADGLDQDLQRVRSVAQTIPGGVNLSLDANQALSFDGAMNLCAGIGDLPVSFVEQPFAPQAWDLTADLATATSVPIMMDESIWHAEDIARASAVGAKFVKLKLCKHRGAKDTLAMIALASDQGLGVVLGNGVQSSLGNHLEAKIYETANLSTAGEFNGFAKFDSPWMPDGMSVENGALVDGGIDPSSVSQPTDQKIFQIDLPT